MRATKHATILVSLLLVACGSSQDPGSTTESSSETSESTETSETETSEATAGSCAAHTDCASCLGVEGCNWTGGSCAQECLMDTYCVGPANPSAPACTSGVLLLGEWQHDMSASEGGQLTFVRGDVELGPARFRRRLGFSDGTEDSPPSFTTNVLAPNDAHGSAEGTWGIEGTTLTLTYPAGSPSGRTTEVFTVDHVDASTLRLTPIPE